ncbi:MAG: YdiU family protein [Woeseiaceae bacterium]|jgi:uncharacterized protein YdiU (UPF0061 family)|nr:YdiU family protein [Woeseiaceae bacterium]
MNLENSYSQLPAAMYAAVAPEPAKHPALLAWNASLADELGLRHLGRDAEECARIFSGGPLPTEIEPVALAYAGHQFGVFVPQLGDGRAALLGEAVDRSGMRRDIQLKGSGRTPFSRGGDGRSWLGPVIREYLVSEAMHALGVPTTRALAAVATGERVYRQDALPGAVFTRVAASHLRVGTFEYLAARQEKAALEALTDYAIDRHFPDARGAGDRHAAFFDAVATRQADLVARWMALGFIHGVMNTDNTSIAGETLDYGPCAFMDEFRYDKVFSSIDHQGRYAYANQPLIAQWNLARLAECLLLVCDSRDAFEATLSAFPDQYNGTYRSLMREKLGLADQQDGDNALIDAFLSHLEAEELDYTLSFRELASRIDADDEPRLGEPEMEWRQRVRSQGRAPDEVAAAMNAVNPRFIPRNHRIEQAIGNAVDGNLAVFRELETVLSQPFEEQPEFDRYAAAPAPAERVMQTFCGT